MEIEGRGALLYAYRPIPANPMAVALLLLVLVVTLGIGPLAAGPEGLWPLGGLCFAPLAVALLAVALFKPSPTRVFEDGIEFSLPLWRRMVGGSRYIRWSDVRDVYPRSYEVAGSFLSPFASSAGTLVHTGIGMETKDGRRILIRFTPGSIRVFRAESRGYQETMRVIRDRFARRNEPMITTAKSYSDTEVLSMQSQAHQPLVRIEGVFTAFFLPPSIVIVLLITLQWLHVGLTAVTILIVLFLALLPPAISVARTLRRCEASVLVAIRTRVLHIPRNHRDGSLDSSSAARLETRSRTLCGSLTSYTWPRHRTDVGRRVRTRPKAMTHGTASAAIAARHGGTRQAFATEGAAENKARRRTNAFTTATGSGVRKRIAGSR